MEPTPLSVPRDELAFINCDRMEEHIRERARRYLAAYVTHTGEIPAPEVIAGAMMLAMRTDPTSAAAITAMYRGLKAIAEDVVIEALH